MEQKIITKREKEIEEMAKGYAKCITSDKDMQVAFADCLRLGAKWADKNPHWLSVEERDIPLGQWVITYAPNEDNYCKIDVELLAMDEAAEDFGITHWMPLPQPPHHFADVSQKVKKGGEG